MTVLGLAGGIGSGKSAVAARLAARPGVRVLLADDLARTLMETDPALVRALEARFGPGTYDRAGRLDRARLARLVFPDAGALADLNRLVHPAVRRAAEAEVARARADGVRLFVYEAAILFETGGEHLADVVAVVDAPVDVRVARVLARGSTTEADVRSRIARQMDPAEARRRADVVLDNAGTLGALFAQADALAERLLGESHAEG